jgi:hypothetical protein
MTRIFVPSAGPGDSKGLLADPEKHWARGYSARSLAHCWEDTEGFPTEIYDVLVQVPSLKGIAPLLIFPEWKVPLPGGSTASQNDVWVLAKCDAGLVSIAIEGKVNESFGDPLGVWRKSASPGKLTRLAYLADVLGLPQPIPDEIYYQLLHRAASALIEAERFQATQSVMLVHSFSPSNRCFEEFKAFVGLYGVEAEIQKPNAVSARNGTPLHFAWVHGDERFLGA